MTYEVEITTFTPAPATERFSDESPSRVFSIVEQKATDRCLVLVAALDHGKNIDHGNFYLWLGAQRALIQLNEHSEHTATDPSEPSDEAGEVPFQEEDGRTFSTPFRTTISRARGLEALRFWLPDQEWFPSLAWK